MSSPIRSVTTAPDPHPRSTSGPNACARSTSERVSTTHVRNTINPVSSSSLRCQFVLEQTLGHVTHTQNLVRLVDGVDAEFLPVEFDAGRWARVPGWSNWTVRAGLRARRAVRLSARRGSRPDVRFVHTQVPAVLLGRELRQVPTVVSLDATPKQYDRLGEFYSHDVGPAWLESVKDRANRACFGRADHLVTWAHWTKASLVDEYGVDPSDVTVIPPGVDTALWLRPGERASDGVVRFLFVGGNLQRKGGHHLLEAFQRLRGRYGPTVELHLVTTSEVAPRDGVTVHSGMTPNSPELIQLYHWCDVFCLPTLGDCLPMVLPEAGAAGLSLVSTDVGAISEIVRHDETGLLVAPNDVGDLTSALGRLIDDRALRRRTSNAARQLVISEHDARANARRVVDVLRQVAASRA